MRNTKGDSGLQLFVSSSTFVDVPLPGTIRQQRELRCPPAVSSSARALSKTSRFCMMLRGPYGFGACGHFGHWVGTVLSPAEVGKGGCLLLAVTGVVRPEHFWSSDHLKSSASSRSIFKVQYYRLQWRCQRVTVKSVRFQSALGPAPDTLSLQVLLHPQNRRLFPVICMSKRLSQRGRSIVNNLLSQLVDPIATMSALFKQKACKHTKPQRRSLTQQESKHYASLPHTPSSPPSPQLPPTAPQTPSPRAPASHIPRWR